MAVRFNPFTGDFEIHEPGGGGLSRASASVTLSGVANGATATGTITLPKGCVLLSVQLSRAGWLRLYSSAAASTADAARARTTAPAQGAGVVADPILAAAGTLELEPTITAANRESPATTSYPLRFTNDGTTGDVTITLSYLLLEA